NPGRGTYKIAGNGSQDTVSDDPYPTFPGDESPGHDFVMVPATDPWVLGTADSEHAWENGKMLSRELCHDPETGALLRKRFLSSTNGNRSTNDIVVTYTYPEDPFGSIVKGTITELKVFGGDSQALATNPAVSLCDLDLSAETPQYHQTFEYDPDNGVMTEARYVNAGGTPLGFKSTDLDIDPATGLITTSRTTDGLATDFDYDQLGRLTWTMPSAAHGGAWSEYRYLNATTTDPAKVESFQRQNSSTTTLITEQEHRFDAIGRLE
ncbi:MAG: hypothetical protein GY836_10815, partial [Herbaspirillum sp.]|uniref:hypothetical protein n=1 Tax=Herbaspirillum sp. TaxID=1890675 RepID=UPI0025895EDA